MICSICNAQNFNTAFCTSCGAPQSGGQSAASQFQQPTGPAAPPAPTPLHNYASPSAAPAFHQSPSPLPTFHRSFAEEATPYQPAWPRPEAPPYQPGQQLRASQGLAIPVGQTSLQVASKFERWLAMFIDGLCSFPLFFFLFIPILGNVILSLALPAYWLLRDLRGASPGKMMLGLRVVQLNGQPPPAGALMMRNLIYAVPHLLHFIPYLGTFLIVVLIVPLNLLESFLVLLTDRRVGDRIAGTLVVKVR